MIAGALTMVIVMVVVVVERRSRCTERKEKIYMTARAQ
jgi:hypothetical protein